MTRPICKAWMWLAMAVLLAMATAGASAQILRDQWVQDAQQRIERDRKTGVRVIVLDQAGRAVPGAKVLIEQQQHDFPLGFTLDRPAWPEVEMSTPVWRCFNAVSLDRVTDWQQVVDDEAWLLRKQAIESLVQQAGRRGMVVRWGGVISADLARNPESLFALQSADLKTTLSQRMTQVLQPFGRRVEQFDLYTHVLDHRFVEQRIGAVGLRQLVEQGRVIAPQAELYLHVKDALQGNRLADMVRRLTDLQQQFIAVDGVTIDQQLSGIIVQTPLERALRWLGTINLDVVIVGLEVGGTSDAGAAINLETVLRMLYAEQAIKGIWFGSITNPTTPGAALIDPIGKPTQAGQLVDNLFRKLWWTRYQGTTDETGNARARIFTGVHRFAAVLPSGVTCELVARVSAGDRDRIIVLEPALTQ